MILRALHDLYCRLSSDPGFSIPQMGYSKQPIYACLILNPDGTFNGLLPLLEENGRIRPVMMQVPGGGKISGNAVRPNPAWDNTGYLLGRDAKDDPQRARKTFEGSRKFYEGLRAQIKHPTLDALCLFMAQWNPESAEGLPNWKEIAGRNLVVRLSGQREYLHDAREVRLWWEAHQEEEAGVVGQCLITGDVATIARVHRTKIKGVRGKKGEYILTGMDDESFWSYGKEQSYNAPVSVAGAFRYATALNELLGPDSRRKIQIGDATTVFWTEKPEPIEDVFGHLLQPTEDADQNARIAALLDAVRAGHHPPEMGTPSTKFYILGLSPNGPRLAVRFWLVSSVEEITRRVAGHFEDVRIIPQWPSDRPHPPLWLLLKQTAIQGKDENIPPTLAGAVMRSILTGAPYPRMLLQAVVRRSRAEQGHVSYLRASLIKGCLNRQFRNEGNREEVLMSLDTNRKEPAYRLGRLFAVLEKIQADALGDPNATITDRFYAAASATPGVVFPRLIRLSQHHLAKLEGGLRVVREKLLQDVADALDRFPPHLALEDQGLFAIGYYHQKKDLYTKKGAKGE